VDVKGELIIDLIEKNTTLTQNFIFFYADIYFIHFIYIL
jgi:hypothetical protein